MPALDAVLTTQPKQCFHLPMTKLCPLPDTERLSVAMTRRWQLVLSTFMISVLLALLAMMLLLPGIELVWNGDAVGLGVGISIVGLWLAAIALVTMMSSLELMRLPDPVLEIGPEGVRDRRISDASIVWDDLDWNRVQLVMPYGITDQVRIVLKRPYPLRRSKRGFRVLGRFIPIASFRSGALFIAPIVPDASTDGIEAAMARFRTPVANI